jgi:hypothetical protein
MSGSQSTPMEVYWEARLRPRHLGFCGIAVSENEECNAGKYHDWC